MFTQFPYGIYCLLRSWGRHISLNRPLSPQMNKWVPVNCQGELDKLLGGGGERGVTCHGLTSHPEGSNYTFQAMKAWKSHGSCESCVVKQTSSHFVWSHVEQQGHLKIWNLIESLHSSQVMNPARVYPSFHSMKWPNPSLVISHNKFFIQLSLFLCSKAIGKIT